MTLATPTIADESLASGAAASRLANSLRGIGVRQVRLACGLVMFSYIFSHFFNHALGNISYATMEWWLTLHIWWWRIPDRQFHALHRRCHAFRVGFVGALSAPAFSLCYGRDHAACAWPEHSALARQSFRDRADCWSYVWPRSGHLCCALVRVLGRSAAYDLCAVRASDWWHGRTPVSGFISGCG